jgi:orotidine-5'-phosphate decarboxylase
LKIGSQLYTAEGPQATDRLAGFGYEIFLDLKFHNIPNTVAGAVSAAADLRDVAMLTLHASGGLGMMRAAREALVGRKTRPMLLGVTVLTSLNSEALQQIGGIEASRCARPRPSEACQAFRPGRGRRIRT